MKNFTYSRAETPRRGVCTLISTLANAKFLGGGTNLVDLMRENIEQPDALVDVTRLAPSGIAESAGWRHLASAPRSRTPRWRIIRLIRQRYPVLSQAILFGASGQIRNMATVGGNIMQRTRCYYFYDEAASCNKRNPGSGCDAIDGFNRIHAILGASEHCIATHPSDMCVALAALDATVHVDGPAGSSGRFHSTTFIACPGDTPHIETRAAAGRTDHRGGTARRFPSRALAVPESSRSRELCVRAGECRGGARDRRRQDRNVRLALGGVAPKPWRATRRRTCSRARKRTGDVPSRGRGGARRRARGYRDNSFKIELAKRTIASVLSELAEQEARQ